MGNDKHDQLITKFDLSILDLFNKLKEYQLGKADAKQVQTLMDKMNLFKKQLDEYREKFVEMSKKFDVVEDIQLLKVKIDQA